MCSLYFNLRWIPVLCLLISCSSPVFSQKSINATDKLTLLFMGDIMGHDEQIWSAENKANHSYNYDDVFRYIKPIISEADIAIANLEVTLAGPPYTGYPQFSSPAELAVACMNAGIDIFATANNHSADRGKKGIISTILKLDSIGIGHTGTFIDSASRDNLSPLIIKKNNISIALLNYTYGTNSIKVPGPVIVNLLDKDLITRDIARSVINNADIIVLFLHWGTEYDTVPTTNQTDLAEHLLSEGADLVIGSHPHVLQKMVWSKNTKGTGEGIVVYSLGNFVSNQTKPKTDGGSIVKIEFTRNKDSLTISEAGYFLTWVYTPIEQYRKRYFILPCSEFENMSTFFLNPADFVRMKIFLNQSREFLNKHNVGIPEYIYNGNSWLLNN